MTREIANSPVTALFASDEQLWADEPRSSQWQRVLRSLRPAKLAVFGIILLFLITAVALAAPYIAPHDPNKVVLLDKLTPPVWQEGGTWEYPLGTDKLGRDILSRMIYGARLSLLIGFGSVALGGLLGTLLGLFSGYYGGLVDEGITLLTEIQLAFPTILLAIAMMAVLGPGVRNVILILSITGWVIYARVVRAQVLSVRELEYVEAAIVLGASDWRIVTRHILPNVLAPLIIIASFAVASAIISEAFLSFLGLGVEPDVPTWGGMLAEGRDVMREAWWLATLPGLAIMFVVLSINAVGDWLNDFLDPQIDKQ